MTATTDADGAFSVALAVPDTGTASYEFTAPAGGSAVFYLEAGAPIELAVLLAARGASVAPDALAVEAGLRAAADSDRYTKAESDARYTSAAGLAERSQHARSGRRGPLHQGRDRRTAARATC